MNERVESILEHMLEDAQDVVAFADEVGSFEVFSKDVKTRKAIVMSLLNIGELANQLPKDFTNAHLDIPWKKMVGMRNVAAHGYHILHLDMVWDTTQTTVPELLLFLESILHDDVGNGDYTEERDELLKDVTLEDVDNEHMEMK
jgi:uncharacterized protein with HEPN domain